MKLMEIKWGSSGVRRLSHSISFSYRSHVSTKHFRDLGDLVRFKSRLKITCRVCEKESVIQPMSLLRSLPSNVPLHSLARKFRCSSCGQKRVKVNVVD